jgi:hypothetical protein
MTLSQIKKAASYFPLAPRRTALKQATRLLQAKDYLRKNGIEAVATDSGFKYERSMGSILQ